jgi:hypothetical protein
MDKIIFWLWLITGWEFFHKRLNKKQLEEEYGTLLNKNSG